jgi:hypothetical protein
VTSAVTSGDSGDIFRKNTEKLNAEKLKLKHRPMKSLTQRAQRGGETPNFKLQNGVCEPKTEPHAKKSQRTRRLGAVSMKSAE